MDFHRGRHRHGRHHRSCPITTGRSGLRTVAASRPRDRERGGSRSGRIRESGFGGVRPIERHHPRSQRIGVDRSGAGQFGSNGRGLAIQAQHQRTGRDQHAPEQERLRGRPAMSGIDTAASLTFTSTDNEAAPGADFARRHIGLDPDDMAEMLQIIGVSSVEELIDQTIPDAIRLRRPLRLGEALSETEALERLQAIASKNAVFTSLIGMGYYGTILPPVIQRNVLENPAWYTAYTPYQPEISQGRLEALLNFQTLVCDLTGMDMANASLLDEPTAAAEAMALARRVSRSKSNSFFVDSNTHPQTVSVLRTRAEPLGWEVECVNLERHLLTKECFGALIQYPGTFGAIPDLRVI